MTALDATAPQRAPSAGPGHPDSSGAPSVAAVVPRMVPGLEAQLRAPDQVFTGHGALRRAHASGAGWLWLMQGGGDPRPDALERLLDARALPGVAPATILCGLALEPGGRIAESGLPGLRAEHPGLVELVGHRALPLRHTTFSNCLIAAGCFTRHGLPDARRAPYAASLWSARALRMQTGYFVPASVVQLATPAHRPGAVGSIAGALWMLASGAWTRGETLRNVGRLLRRESTEGGP
ncbi:MAG: hypothetical protein ACRDMX_05280 [Solirubrobacteraceae bacterium]